MAKVFYRLAMVTTVSVLIVASSATQAQSQFANFEWGIIIEKVGKPYNGNSFDNYMTVGSNKDARNTKIVKKSIVLANKFEAMANFKFTEMNNYEYKEGKPYNKTKKPDIITEILDLNEENYRLTSGTYDFSETVSGISHEEQYEKITSILKEKYGTPTFSDSKRSSYDSSSQLNRSALSNNYYRWYKTKWETLDETITYLLSISDSITGFEYKHTLNYESKKYENIVKGELFSDF